MVGTLRKSIAALNKGQTQQTVSRAAGQLALDDTRKHIGGIVVTIGPKYTAIGNQMVIKLRPPSLPPLGHTHHMEHRRRIGQDTRLLVVRLVEPLDA